MEDYIQYHNPKRMGVPVEAALHSGFKIVTKKSASHAIGNRIWLLAVDEPKHYYLAAVFVAEKEVPDEEYGFKNAVIGNKGIQFIPKIEITGYPWLEGLMHEQGNFGLGLNRTRTEFARELQALANQYLEFLRE